MDITELVAYAEEKYNISVEHKWDNFPGFSVMTDPKTGKWIALLIRRWDQNTGEVVGYCDLKCGRDCLATINAAYLSPPFRMQGLNWVGIRFDGRTDPQVVYRLFDKAVSSDIQLRSMVFLGSELPKAQTKYRDTPLPFRQAKQAAPAHKDDNIPDKIAQMQDLYDYGNGSFHQKCKNFYVQGKFMEDYEDDYQWGGEILRYFPTYHDLRPEQLRHYFSWRTQIRKGNYQRISTSLAYIYLYELINGIGTSSVEDSLAKMKEFEVGYIDSGIGEKSMRLNIRRWILELAVVKGAAPEIARKYVDGKMIKTDDALAVLKEPDNYSDQEVFDALCTLGRSAIATSVVVKKYGDDGVRLFAQVWRIALEKHRIKGRTLFSKCFGIMQTSHFKPLGNAVYYQEKKQEDVTYDLDKMRKFFFKNGFWKEQHCEIPTAKPPLLNGLLQETDRRLRLYFDLGHPLLEKSENAWAAPYIDEVIAADKQAKLDAAKPKITIQFSDLDRIRQDALETQDSLLTEEERREEAAENAPDIEENPAADQQKDDLAAPDTLVPLDDFQIRLLKMLLGGESVKAAIAEQHGMPEVIADSLNEALFDEIGDTAVECDGGTIVIVEDYREDIMRILGGNSI